MNMPSRTDPPTIWPAGWPSFSPKDKDKSSSEELRLNLKREIIAEYGEESLTKAWLKTCDALRQVTSSIAEAGSAYIPAFEFKDVVGPDNSDILEEMKAKGGFIIRNVIPRAIADQLFKEQVEFIANNDEIRAWPAENPAIFNIHNGPVQLQLRTHPNQLKLQRLLNSLFTDSKCTTPDESMKQSEPVLYPDALRIRQPGQEFLGLGPHIDAGSLSRWADPDYRKTYHKILAGDPEHFDPYDLSHRRDAKPGMFPSGVHGTTLRTFQGWTALTPCGPGEGGLLLVPDVQVVTAYWMLRPFFKSPDDGDWEDPARWTLDDTAWFPGTFAWDSQLLSPVSHPNLRLEETLVNVPRVLPGDTVWWHCDVRFTPVSCLLDQH